MKKLFLKSKPSAVLLLLKDGSQGWYPSKLARESKSSYVHVVNLLSKLRELGIVATEKKGKQNIYHLTEKGAMLASPLDDFSKKCDAYAQELKAAQAARQEAQAQMASAPAQTADKKEEKKQEAEKN